MKATKKLTYEDRCTQMARVRHCYSRAGPGVLFWSISPAPQTGSMCHVI